MITQMKRCWAEISLDNLEHNYREIRAHLPEESRFLGVVKANAYGHGAVEVAEKLEKLGADYLAVAFIDEAIELREHGITLPILILGYTAPEYTELLIANSITQSVSSLDSAAAYAKRAVQLNRTLKCHLKIDSGMGRMGMSAYREQENMLRTLCLDGLEFEGAFTHFALSDIPNDDYTTAQYKKFITTVKQLEKISGKKFKLIHCANSGAVINYSHTCGTMVRPGILLYGHYPDKDCGTFSLRPVMTLKTRIVQIKDVHPGESISYGKIWTAEKETSIAVLSIGYADGLSRLLSNRAEFLLNGRRIKQVGRICMDMCMADISDVENAAVGDEVIVFGQELPIEELAEKLGTISYELLCDVSVRVPRIYTQSGEI